MKARIVKDIPFPDGVTLEQVHNWHIENGVPVVFKDGKAYYRVYEVEYDPEEVHLDGQQES